MKLVLYNTTYHNCPVELREQLAFTEHQQRSIIKKMHTEEAISDAVILQTCNRLEFYIYVKKSFDCGQFLTNSISEIAPQAALTWDKYSRMYEGIDVVQHLFEVAAGLDSQMIGENQILTQVKLAYTMSLDCRMSKLIFHRLFHNAFRVGKAVRTDTNINCGAVSISLAAVELARKSLDLSNCSALVIGAGETAELAAKYLAKTPVANLIIANRDTEKAQAITTRLKAGRVIPLNYATAILDSTDLLIASTAATEHLLTHEMVKDSLEARNKPLLIIDIAVPRDIDPRIANFDCVTLVNIDDLNEQIEANKEKRNSEIPKAKKIVQEFTEAFYKWYESLDLVPLISELTKHGIDLARSEAKRYAKDFNDIDNEKLELFAESLVKKILHGPISFLKGDGSEDSDTQQLQAAELIDKMFLSRDKRS